MERMMPSVMGDGDGRHPARALATRLGTNLSGRVVIVQNHCRFVCHPFSQAHDLVVRRLVRSGGRAQKTIFVSGRYPPVLAEGVAIFNAFEEIRELLFFLS